MNGRTMTRAAWFLIWLASGAALAGCGKSQAQMGPPKMPPPEVKVSLPIRAMVPEDVEFPGRIMAVNSVEIRARVTGYLDKVNFREGTDVKSGEVLFEIDPRPYQVDLDRAKGNVTQARGRLKRMKGDYERAQGLEAKGAISKEEMSRVTSERTVAEGALKVNEAALKLAELNMDFTEVKAPIGGRISSRTVDPGNLVKADDTSLTTVVSLDPIYAVFDLDERSLLRLKRLIRERKIEWSLDSGLPVYLGLSDEAGFPHKGVINFADNRVDAETGTWRLRGKFTNPDLHSSANIGHIPEHALSPGLFVRVRLPLGESHDSILIPEAALGTNQGQKFVFVVDGKGLVQQRDITVGRLYKGMRVVVAGLTMEEKIVVDGLQRVRNGTEVNAELVPTSPLPVGDDDQQVERNAASTAK